MNSYHLIDKLSNQYTSRERVELVNVFLKHMQTMLGLTKDDLQTIKENAEEPPSRCTHVYTEGTLRGTKCRKKTKKRLIVVSDPSQPVIKPDKCVYHFRH